MKRKMLMVCSLLLVASIAHGEQVVKKDAFWEKLGQKLEKLTPAKKGATTTAVGGVRGAKNDEATDIYWKGKEKSVEMAQDEMQLFTAAIESRMKGDNEAALKQFEEFLVMYPQSSFRVEGLQAAEKIRQEIATASSPTVRGVPAAVAAPPAVTAEPAALQAPAPAAVPSPDAVPEPVK